MIFRCAERKHHTQDSRRRTTRPRRVAHPKVVSSSRGSMNNGGAGDSTRDAPHRGGGESPEDAGSSRREFTAPVEHRLTAREIIMKPSTKAHVIVLAGPLLALVFTLFTLTGSNSARFIPGVWLLAVLWTFLTALTAALWCVFRHRDSSAFTAYTLPPKEEDEFEWACRTGRHAWRRDYEEGGLYDDSTGHGPIA